MQSLGYLLRLARFGNCAIAAIGVFVGAWLIGWRLEGGPVYWAALATALVCGAGNIVNDIVDLPIDRRNRPDRMLPRGLVPIPRAWMAAHLANLFGVGSAALVGWPVAIVGISAIALLFAYNFGLKAIPLLGNLLIALLSGLTLITGSLAFQADLTWHWPIPLLGAVLGLLFHLVREIIKDTEDMAGDAAVGVVTYPQLVGPTMAVGTAFAVFIALALLAVTPALDGTFGRTYLFLVLFGVIGPSVGALIAATLRPERALLGIASLVLKLGMVVGLGALVLAAAA